MNKQEFLVDGEIVEADVATDGDVLHITVGENQYALQPVGEGLFSVFVNGRRKVIAVARDRDRYYLDIDSVLLEIREATEDAVGGAAGDLHGDKDKVFAPMPGKIVKLLVAAGDHVEPRQQLVIVEAMKMENPVPALAAGTVKTVNFKAGDQVDTETPIIELLLDDEESSD